MNIDKQSTTLVILDPKTRLYKTSKEMLEETSKEILEKMGYRVFLLSLVDPPHSMGFSTDIMEEKIVP